MVSHFRRRSTAFGRLGGRVLVAIALGGALAVAGCDKLPLLAPSGTVITLFATSNVLAANGSVEIVATVIEQGSTSTGTGTPTAGAGTPVHNGTLVTFTTTIGSIDPREARTHNGQVTVRLTGDGRSGVAKVTAFSGGASGTIDINVGAAAAERVVLTASPQTVPSTGGTVQLTARVEDVSGNGLGGIPVTFSATGGALQAASVFSDDQGFARNSLTTTREVDVTVTAGSKTATVKVTVAARTGIAITPPTASPTAGSPASFAVAVSATANIRDVTVEWGDGSSTSLGALSSSTSVSHVYGAQGTYTVRATATDAAGNSESVSTTVTVLPPVPLAVTLTASPSTATRQQPVTFTATVTATGGTAPQIVQYEWSFGDGTTAITTGPSTSKSYSSTGTKVVRVTVTANNGQTGFAQIEIEINP